jgi:phage terminase large subunit-like protein
VGGNWKIRPAAGLYFKREWCTVVDQAPADLDVVRYWDLAATEKTELNDPD